MINSNIIFKFITYGRKLIISTTLIFSIAAPEIAGAYSDEKMVPVRNSPDVPGMIQMESCVRPVYPKEENHYGVVTLRLLIGIDGQVKESAIAKSSGYWKLDKAALEAISKCNFNPVISHGKLVEAWLYFQYDWKKE